MNLLGFDNDEPMDKIRVNCPVWEAPATDPDALQHPVAGELVHHKGRVEQERRLKVVWNNAANEVRIC